MVNKRGFKSTKKEGSAPAAIARSVEASSIARSVEASSIAPQLHLGPPLSTQKYFGDFFNGVSLFVTQIICNSKSKFKFKSNFKFNDFNKN